jgi:hypothetical protein
MIEVYPFRTESTHPLQEPSIVVHHNAVLYPASCLLYTSIAYLKYADDLVLWVSLKTLSDIRVALQLDLHSLELWCVNNNMEINGSKTKSMIITPKMNVLENIDLTILGESIDEVQTFRYLGLTIDKNLTWNT